MLTVLTSGKAAPGVTTSAWALALGWPRPLLVADCDAGGGDMAPGLLAGRVALDRGLLSWSAATRRASVVEAAELFSGHAVAVPEAPEVWLVPGVQSATQAAALNEVAWERLGSALRQALSTLGRDALVDTGRLSEGSCWPVMRAADRVVLVVRPTVRSVHAASAAAGRLRETFGDDGRVTALVVGEGPYDAREVASSLGLPLLGQLPFDKDAAAALSDGATGGVRNLFRTRLLKSAQEVAQGLLAQAPVLSEAAR